MTDIIVENSVENSKTSSTRGGSRDSNIELFRIIVMLLIVAHHYVVNSGLTAADGVLYSNPFAAKSIFLLIFGMWGKTGINCFVLITGWFMCKSNITIRKFLKLLLQIYLYRIVIFLLFLFTGYEQLTIVSLAKVILPVTSVGSDFTSCYLLFFLTIPFLNILIKNMTEKQHLMLVSLCLLVYTVIGSIPKIYVSMNYVTWFIVIYFIASYLRLYPKSWSDSTKLWGWLTLSMIIVSIASVLVLNWVGYKIGRLGLQYYFVADSNKILAVFTSVTAFVFFKNLNVPQSRFVNTVAASTFGVLLIHANSDAMRQWLWVDTLKNVEAYSGNIYLHAILSVVAVFTVCTLIDILRRKLIEKPVFDLLDKKLFDKNS